MTHAHTGLELFDSAAQAKRLARRSDPSTSAEAAAIAVRASHQAVIAARTVFAGGGCFTDEDLSEAIGFSGEVARHARLHLARLNEVEVCGRQKLASGSFGRLWRMTVAADRGEA